MKACATHDLDKVLAFYTPDVSIVTNPKGKYTYYLGHADVVEFFESLWKQGYARANVRHVGPDNSCSKTAGQSYDSRRKDEYAVVLGHFHVFGEGSSPAVEASGPFWKVLLKVNDSWYTDLERLVFAH